MTDPVDHETSTGQPPPATSASRATPAVEWAQAPPTGDTSATAGRNPVMEIVVWVVALAALLLLSLGRAGSSGATGSERIGYALGAATGALLIATAVRWLWLRVRHRNDPNRRLLSPWIAVGAVIFAALTIGSAS